MGMIGRPAKIKLITGLLSNDVHLFVDVKRVLERHFGRIDFESDAIDFAHTDYYEAEFGSALKRKFFSFERLFSSDGIYKAKIKTNAIERRFLDNGNRKINVDPGYLSLSKLVLFSTKDFSHRIYLAGGISAEVTLYYQDRKFNPWPWTYPDYKTEAYLQIFNKIRDIYKDQIKRG